MTDADLKKQLATLAVPSADPVAQARALHRATIALRTPQTTSPHGAARPRSSWFGFRAAATAVATLCIGLGLGWWLAPRPAAQIAINDAGSRQLLAQLNHLFPGQLNAVIEREGALQLDLGPQANTVAAPADQALVVELHRDGRRLRILAYSGRPVRFELEGVFVRIEPLITSNGGVLLASDDFVWSSAQPAARALDGWEIAARSLALPL